MKTRQEIDLLFLNEDVITPLLSDTNRGSSFHPMVIGPIRRALPHRDKHEAAFRKGGMIREVFLCGWRRGECVCVLCVRLFFGCGGDMAVHRKQHEDIEF